MNISTALENSLMLTRSQLRRDHVRVKNTIAAEQPLVMAQVNELEQVFINILSNARHALNERYPEPCEEKSITISSENLNMSPTPFLRISFHDKGIGIPVEIINKIRNPFFSTWKKAKGTGLGLSISHGIIDKHGGRLSIESVQNKYTTVHIDLPVYQQELELKDNG